MVSYAVYIVFVVPLIYVHMLIPDCKLEKVIYDFVKLVFIMGFMS